MLPPFVGPLRIAQVSAGCSPPVYGTRPPKKVLKTDVFPVRTIADPLQQMQSTERRSQRPFGRSMNFAHDTRDAANMSPTGQNTHALKGTSGAARTRKIFSRIYGTLAVALGLLGAGLATLVIWIRSTGGSVSGSVSTPVGSLKWLELDTLPASFGPYHLATSLICVVLGVLIFRQSAMAAIVFLCFTVAVDLLSGVLPGNFPREFNAESFTNINVIYYAILLTLTATVAIADRAARSADARR
jgi:hypothetical protein